MKRILLLILIAGIVTAMHAQDSSAVNSSKKNLLNSHVFPSFSNFNSPFITTALNINVGGGSTSLITIPPIDIGDVQTPEVNGYIMFTGGDVGYEQRFTPWLSLYFNVKMLGRFGTDAFSLLYDGINTISGGDIGWRIRVLQSKKFILSTSFFVNNLSGNFINIKKFVNDIIENEPNPAIINNTPLLQVGLSATYAYAFNETWGLQGETKIAYGETFEWDIEHITFTGSLFGDIDFYPKHHFPLGIGLGYMLSSAPELTMGSEGFYNLALFKLSYTGSTDYDLGIEYMTYKLNIGNRIDNPFISIVSLALKFYF